jgi:hypothetical protein
MHEKIKFADIPVGTYFTYVGTTKKVHCFKIEEIEVWEDGYVDTANAVIIKGLRPGTLTAFGDDEEVYAGTI